MIKMVRAGVAACVVGLAVLTTANAAEAPEPPHQNWSFEGPLGTFDRAAPQRGYQIYKEVCSACHSMNQLYYRNLAALGFNDAEIKALQDKVRDARLKGR